MAEFGGTYSTGSASFTNGNATATFSGTLMTTIAEEGDQLLSGGVVGLVKTVTDDTHLELAQGWAGSTVSGASYVLLKTSWLRYEPALTQKKVRELLAYFDANGVFYFVSGTVPDPQLGDDGQWALKVNDGAWKLWYKIDGTWELMGAPVGVTLADPLAFHPATTYPANYITTYFGTAYRSKRVTVGDVPPSSPDDWDVFVTSGGRYDIWFGDSDQPSSGETLFKGVVPTAITIPAGLGGSYAYCDVAATASSVVSLRKNSVEFGTLTFSSGASTGTFASASGAAFAAGDILSIVAPSPRDDTLRGIYATITGYR